ncbi:MAG TPA: hypothetical protein VEC99_19265, partial [Clostridia bacterium]|nr:hypothetical protein [Clostridia bacterium]
TATLDIAKTAVSDLASQLAKMAQAQADSMLKGIGNELADKAKALCQSTSGNSNLQAKVDSSMQALMAGNDSSALATLFQTVKEASLTPQQVQLVKEFGNLTSAYVVQRNFSSLDGMQGDVATIVSSLRKGEVTPAIPSIQKVAQNANLTVSQKELIGSLTERYAPGLKGAASTLQQGFQTLQGLKGVGK